MTRAILELLVTIIVVIVARAIFNSFLKGIAGASANAFQQGAKPEQQNQAPRAAAGTELHKDPVCGTYVPESTAFRRQVGGTVFYYCSENCRNAHR